MDCIDFRMVDYPASGAIRSGGTDIDDDDDVLVLSSVDANDVEHGQRE